MDIMNNSDLIMALGPSVGVFFLAIYFVRTFVSYQREIMISLVDEMKEARKLQAQELEEYKNSVNNIDARLHNIEKILDK